MNPRTYRKMLKINERLAEYSQTTRIIELLPNQVTLNNGTILIENDANRFVNRVMNKKIVEWVMNIDKLRSEEHTSELQSH